MGTSPGDFHKRILERVLDVLWSQWAAIGVYANAPEYRAAVIDPEAMVCATVWFGRYAPRLFDEAMDWMSVNEDLLSLDRLKSIARVFPRDSRAVLGTVMEYLAGVAGKGKFQGKSSGWREERPKKKEALFRSWPHEGEPAGANMDETFLSWDYERGRIELRGMSAAPDMRNPANLRFVLRDLLGMGVRAEVMVYLILAERGNSSQIAKAINHNQRAVYKILDDFARGGFAHRREVGRVAVFSVDTERWRRFIGLKETKRFIQWTNVFSAIQEILYDRIENDSLYRSPYLASSRFKELSPLIFRRLSEAGLVALPPDPRKHPGEKYNDVFMGYIDGVIRELSKPDGQGARKD